MEERWMMSKSRKDNEWIGREWWTDKWIDRSLDGHMMGWWGDLLSVMQCPCGCPLYTLPFRKSINTPMLPQAQGWEHPRDNGEETEVRGWKELGQWQAVFTLPGSRLHSRFLASPSSSQLLRHLALQWVHASNQKRLLLWTPAPSCTPNYSEGRVVSGLDSHRFFSVSEVLLLNSCASLYSRVPGVLMIESNRRKGRSLIPWHPWVFLWLSPGDGFPILCLSPSIHMLETQGYITAHHGGLFKNESTSLVTIWSTPKHLPFFVKDTLL